MLEIINEYLNLQQIADSGQVFRWQKTANVDECEYLILAVDKAVIAKQEGNKIFLFCEKKEEDYWKNYFDLQTDYAQIIANINNNDLYLQKAAKAGEGIRILRQDFWEMLVSFIISQNNNIPRIKKSIERLCEKFGMPKQIDSYTYYTFPTIEQLKGHSLEDLGLGYRQRYLEKLVSDGVDLDFYQDLDFVQAKKNLKEIVGVGEKVACCVALFGLHHLEAFPIDTWMKKVQEQIYGGSFDMESYGKYGGVFQQYLFYYIRTQEEKDV
jgi:N-glycosylase/DNA lyase